MMELPTGKPVARDLPLNSRAAGSVATTLLLLKGGSAVQGDRYPRRLTGPGGPRHGSSGPQWQWLSLAPSVGGASLTASRPLSVPTQWRPPAACQCVEGDSETVGLPPKTNSLLEFYE